MIELKDVKKYYQMGDSVIKAVDDISFKIMDGKCTVILGPSGSGKSTTLNLLGGMDTVTSGEILLDLEDISKYSEKELENYRREKIGFVFQFYNLIPQLTIRENVGITADMVSDSLDVDEVINAVGLEKRKNLFPQNLSGGELQRVAIARALVKNPRVLLCDEPTGALDSETGKMILKLLKETSKKHSISLIIVTHNSAIEKIADQVIRVKDGKVVSDTVNENPLEIDEVVW
ncbi:ABC transporter ATP-binding protein [Lachnobacterium bovis]|uniref:Putative ABC transport system ATP-binding protein n=1 Tax=Lachnobacterium bovis DSM 14045 TaxID=1122142 RepID=A0A1H3L1M4_9FIRM|nr:ABC transporter ATP-binding protein [Lachnobacterium bovis]SDY57814.1 putative ABC transport system ATP-binding protein [Lachnobacterium bovis DSM 14045]